MENFWNKYIILIIGLILLLGWKASAETLSGYQEGIQRIFIREAANKNMFIKAVQTARLLGYLEFVESENFLKFHQCMSKEKGWEYLSAQKRQTTLNECRGYGRTISGVVFPVQPTLAVSPAAAQKQEQEIVSLRKDLDVLRSMIEKMSADIRNNQTQLLETLNIPPQRTPSQAVIPVPEERFVPEQ